MKISRIRKDNRGDSLILVIGCIALLSILGVVILAKTMDNQTMKLAEEKAQESFFKADSASSELAIVLENVTQEVVEKAFTDMLVEYSGQDSGADRQIRYKAFFTAALKDKLQSASGSDALQTKLAAALGTPISGLTITYDGVVVPTTTPVAGDKTDEIIVKNVVISYEADNSKTTISTDICIQADVPSVDISNVKCDFADFALISDEAVQSTTAEGLTVKGNLYTGGDFTATMGSKIDVSEVEKMLVRGTMKMDGASSEIKVNSDVALPEGKGIWTDGIFVNGGKLTTDNVNLYVSDDLTVDGNNSTVVLKGDSAEYLGYSGGISTLPNYRRSSAITINNAKNMTLDMSNLNGGLYIKGASYIFDEDKWTAGMDGILQGESVAYKDMQAMYLVPGDCMAEGHNPVMTATESTDVVSYVHEYIKADGTPATFNFEGYLDDTTKTVTRTSMLDGTTQTTYVYLNFKSEAEAAKYVKDYLATTMGDSIRYQGTNMGASQIMYPTTVHTSANALEYDGTTVSWKAAADTVGQMDLTNRKLLAQMRYRSLFSKLQLEGGTVVSPTYKMVKDNLLKPGAFSTIPLNSTQEVMVQDPLDATKEYRLVIHNGDLTIGDLSPYHTINGMLVVNGDVTFSASTASVNGLVLVTGKVKVTTGVTLDADETAVETLLSDENVSKYFGGFGDGSDTYSSSEAIDIEFKNWKKN